MDVNFDNYRFVVETGGVGDEMSIAKTTDGICFEIHEPWQGDTETGFGATCSVTIDIEAARKLHDWLKAALV